MLDIQVSFTYQPGPQGSGGEWEILLMINEEKNKPHDPHPERKLPFRQQ